MFHKFGESVDFVEPYYICDVCCGYVGELNPICRVCGALFFEDRKSPKFVLLVDPYGYFYGYMSGGRKYFWMQ